MRKAELTDDALCDAVSEMAQGLVDADLGGHVVKKRVALPGQGKRGGARCHRGYQDGGSLVSSSYWIWQERTCQYRQG